MSTREVITLQIGHYSNFVGTHWWNMQESSFVYDPKILAQFPKEVNHDILFREGKTIRGDVTYTPRLVLFDLSNSLGSLKKEGTLYDVGNEDNIKWLGDVTLHQTPAAQKNKFLQDLDEEWNAEMEQDGEMKIQSNTDREAEEIDKEVPSTSSSKSEQVFGHHIYNLGDDVDVWSDYLRTALHPRSTNILKGYHHNNPEQPFNIFGLGQQICDNREQWDAFEDRLHYFTEECDSLQGFQILLDSHNAFGGLAASSMTFLADEFSNKSRFSFAVTPACPPDQTAIERSSRILNSALCLHHCSDHSSLYVPLSLASTLWRNVGPPLQLPYLQYKESLDYHTSAILAASIDTMTMPYRRETEPAKMNDITSSFSSVGRKVAALNTSLPFPLPIGSSFAESLMSHGETDPWFSLTPHVKCSSSPIFNSCVVRGIPANMIKGECQPGSSPRLLASCTTVDDIMRLYLSETYPSSFNAGCVMRDGVKVGTPYPHIFSSNINYQGLVTDTQRQPYCGVETVPMMTSLQSSADVYSYIDSLEGCVSKLNIAKHQHFIEAGLEPDEFTEAVENLKTLAQCYRQNSDS